MDLGKLNAWLPTWGQRSKPTDFRGHLPRLYNFLRTAIKIQNWRGFSLKENGGNAPKWKSEDASLGRDSGSTAGNDALQIRLVTSDLVQRPDCRECFLKMGISSKVSLLGGGTMKGFTASDHYDKAKQIVLTALSTPWEKNTPESTPKHVLVKEGSVINICFWKMAYNSDFIVQYHWNKNIFLCDNLSKIVLLFFFLFFLQQLLDS